MGAGNYPLGNSNCLGYFPGRKKSCFGVIATTNNLTVDATHAALIKKLHWPDVALNGELEVPDGRNRRDAI